MLRTVLVELWVAAEERSPHWDTTEWMEEAAAAAVVGAVVAAVTAEEASVD